MPQCFLRKENRGTFNATFLLFLAIWQNSGVGVLELVSSQYNSNHVWFGLVIWKMNGISSNPRITLKPCLLKQWAAVRMCFLEMTVPPQKWVLSITSLFLPPPTASSVSKHCSIEAMNGYSPLVASFPPTILRFRTGPTSKMQVATVTN